MDGRRLRLWLCGATALCGGAVGCAGRQTAPPGPALPPAVQSAKKSPSFFGGSSAATAPAPAPAPQQPVAATPRKPGEKKEWSADSMVAFADLRASVALSPDRPEAERAPTADSAREAYQNALKKDPKHKGAVLGLARLYAGLGEQARADEQFRKYLAMNPTDHAVAHEAALAHARHKDWAGAVAWCRVAMKMDPENRAYRKSVGFMLTHAGKWEEGFAALCEVMPEAQARYSMAKALTHLGQTDMGKMQLALAVQADPAFAPAREYLAELQSTDGVAVPRTVEAADPVQAAGFQQPTP